MAIFLQNERLARRWGPFDTAKQAWEYLRSHQKKRRSLSTFLKEGWEVVSLGTDDGDSHDQVEQESGEQDGIRG